MLFPQSPWRVAVLLVSLAVLLSCAACRGNLYHSQFREMDDCQWDGNDTLRFDVPPSPTSRDVNLSVALRTLQRFGYMRATVRVSLCRVVTAASRADSLVPLSSHLRVIPLYDEDDRALGDGSLRRVTQSGPIPLRLKAGERYAVVLFHRMADNPLGDVEAVGLIVTE